jgi:hypothetical protein
MFNFSRSGSLGHGLTALEVGHAAGVDGRRQRQHEEVFYPKEQYFSWWFYNKT